MKKIIVFCFLIFILTGCSEKNMKNEQKPKKIITKNEETKIKNYNDENDVIIGIYRFYNNVFNLTTDYSDYWNQDKDVSYYSIFYSNENTINSSHFATTFNYYKNNFKSTVKHGFEFTFNTTNGKFKKTILKPDDVWEIFPYIQIYLYDDIFHQNDSWYSHTEQKDYTDNTLFTTFKITMGNPSLITSDINVKAFTYDSLDDFEKGWYRGNNSFSFKLKRQ